MTDFATSYLGRLRRDVGSRLLLVPGMRVVVENGAGQVLLQLRSDYGLWGLPGGVPDEREAADAAAIRETLEETGLLIEAPRPFGFASDPSHEVWTYPNGDQCHYFTLLLEATRFTGELIADNDESLQVRWFDPADLPPVLPVMQRTIDAHRRFRRDGTFQMI